MSNLMSNDWCLLETMKKRMSALRTRKEQKLKQWATTLKEAQDQLLYAGRSVTLSELTAGVVHEVNNALTAIMGFAEIWKDDQSLPDEVKEDFSAIFRAGMRARDILNLLLSLGRETQNELDLKSVELPELCQQALKLMNAPLRWGQIQIVCDYSPQTPVIVSDPNRIVLIILNLIQNAKDAITFSGKGRQIIIRTHAGDKGEAVLDVEDDGPGIPEAISKDIFEPLFTTKPAGKGTGLGLFLVRKLVADIKGQIHFTTSKGKGTKFTVVMPNLKTK